MLAVLAVAVVFTTTLAILQWRRAHDLAHAHSVRNAAGNTAGEFGIALYTYDYTDLAGARARVLKLATARFAKTYQAAVAPAAQATITRLKVRESARVTGIFLTNVAGNRAAAIVVLDTTVQSTDGTRTSVDYVQMGLVPQGSSWKVDVAKAIVATR